MSASQSSATNASSQAQEYVVRVPKNTEKKRHHVMRFNSSMNIDFATWSQGRLERENNQKDLKLEEEMPKFGAGSEYGRQQREEAKRRKYGMAARKYNPDDQPWLLRIGGKAGKKYRGLREGGVSENASYYVFKNASDGAFEAFPIEEWYNFIPIQTYKTLNAEEAEEEFGRRDKVFNYFSIMMKKRLKAEEGGGEGEGDEKLKKGGKKSGEFKISDNDDWANSSDGEDEDEEEGGSDAEKKKANKKKKLVNSKKKKKKAGSDDEAIEESDDGDDEGREVDYISDESSSSDDLNDSKIKGDIKGVEDEEAIRKMEDSESEEENEEGEKKEPAAEVKEEPPKETKEKREESSSDTSSDTSDSDDFDSSFHSAMFMPDKKGGNSKKASKKSKKEAHNSNRTNTPSRSGDKNASNDTKRSDNDIKLEGFSNKRNRNEPSNEKNELKRPMADSDKIDGFSAKRLKLEHGASSSSSTSSLTSLSIDGITEDAVRRYLMRKPMTTTELIQKFKSKKSGLSRDQMVNTITQILKRLNPDRQMIKGKMYLSVKHS
ncbi:hypothetical protein CHUAL_011621 [Chamberlinius hualienensis]